MPKKYRRILAGTAAIGVVAAVWLWQSCYHPTAHRCIAGMLAAAGGCAANLLWRAYLRYDLKKRRKRRHMECQSTTLVSDIRE